MGGTSPSPAYTTKIDCHPSAGIEPGLQPATLNPAPSIRMEGAGFKVAGWSPGSIPAEGWQSIFVVYAGDGDVPPMLGSYAVESGALVFRPRFPLAPGVRSRAVFHPPGRSATEAVFEARKVDMAPSTRVEQVYPSSGLLPDNQLKFYVHFSAPMRRGEAWGH